MLWINHLYQTALLDGLSGNAAICRAGMEAVRINLDGLVSFQWFAVFLGRVVRWWSTCFTL
jgi:hypothetical protein